MNSSRLAGPSPEPEDMAIALDGVSVLRGDVQVLSDVSLRLGPRDRLAITGDNGAGKTTLLRAIVGLETVTAGRVCLDGRACRTEADFRQARRGIGFLFQSPDDQLFCPTVIEDVAFGPLNTGLARETAVAHARQALATLGLEALAERPVDRLSGGQKRLVCLAGLLATAPRTLLLDEPTVGVDAKHRAVLLATLEGFAGAILLVSHDEATVARLATHEMRLGGGRLQDAPPPG